MSYSRRSRYSRSPLTSPYRCYSSSVSRSGSRSRSRSSDVENPGNNLYVTGLSSRTTKRELERHFSVEGTVEDVHVVIDPWTRESRGFGFVTMSSVKDADYCIKYLDGSKLDGRIINVEKARRRRGRTPTPGRYLGLKRRERGRSSSYTPPRPSLSYYNRRRSPCYYSPHRRSPSYRRYRSPSYSPRHRSPSRSWSGSPQYSFGRSRSRSYSPYYRRQRSNSPYHGRERSYSSNYQHHRSKSPHYSKRRYDYTRYKCGGESCSQSCSPCSGSTLSHRPSCHSSEESSQSWERTNRCNASPRARSRTRRRSSRSITPDSRSARS